MPFVQLKPFGSTTISPSMVIHGTEKQNKHWEQTLIREQSVLSGSFTYTSTSYFAARSSCQDPIFGPLTGRCVHKTKKRESPCPPQVNSQSILCFERLCFPDTGRFPGYTRLPELRLGRERSKERNNSPKYHTYAELLLISYPFLLSFVHLFDTPNMIASGHTASYQQLQSAGRCF